MSTFNLTDNIIWQGRRAKEEIIGWLNDNIGIYYGVGDPERNVIAVGNGWEIRTLREIEYVDGDECSVTNWIVDITDDAKSTHFALVWIK